MFLSISNICHSLCIEGEAGFASNCMKIFYTATSEIAFRLFHSMEFSSLPYLALAL